ncbi:hypothetical protein ACSLBF_06360 [Pseudoalteromonas sp. T1lg65]|uniref:hypothetical protein n=1 Tax=Pseudoalteromonas sp. T1lg65 TaxID=2077101 RepID=UPI003F7A31EC
MSLIKTLVIKSLKNNATKQAANVVIEKAVQHGKAYLESRKEADSQAINSADELLLSLQHILASKPSDGVYSVNIDNCRVRVRIQNGAIVHLDKIA